MNRRALTASALLVPLALAAAVAGTSVPAAAKPGPKTGLAQTSVEIDDSGHLMLGLTCASAKTCKGWVRVRLGGSDTPKVTYKVPAKGTGSVMVMLASNQVDAVPAGGSTAAVVRVAETTPYAIAARSVPLTFTRTGTDPEPEPVIESRAYREKNWTPTAYDSCPASLHKAHAVVAKDHKLYPTWHAATDTDPATGKTCTYGHEHGDDPRSSDIYGWVTDFLLEHPENGEIADADRGLPFGAVSEALDTYAEGHDHVTRHEDNVGHKVIVADDVKMVAASPRGYVRDADGEIVTCDFLIKVHQGSHSADALTNNAHETLYAVRCTDGTALISNTLSRFGDANAFQRSCDATTTIGTSGSNLPDGFGGSRQIPDRFCVDRDVLVPQTRSSSVWSLYEVWKSENRIRTTDGTVLADFDPWFGIRNPARAHSGTASTILDLVDTLWLVDPADSGTAQGYPWDEVPDHEGHLPKADPTSPFDGAQRDYYLGQTEVRNAGGVTTWYTDPYGDNASTTPGPGLVAQYVGATSNDTWPTLERRSFDLQKDYGNGNGVHAPN